MTIRWGDFLSGAAGAMAASAGLIKADDGRADSAVEKGGRAIPGAPQDSCKGEHAFNSVYHGDYLEWVSNPLGRISASSICFERNGECAKFALHNTPEL